MDLSFIRMPGIRKANTGFFIWLHDKKSNFASMASWFKSDKLSAQGKVILGLFVWLC